VIPTANDIRSEVLAVIHRRVEKIGAEFLFRVARKTGAPAHDVGLFEELCGALCGAANGK